MGPWPPPTYPKVWCYAVGTGLSIGLILLTAAHIAGRPLGMVALFPPTWVVVSGALGSLTLLLERHSASLRSRQPVREDDLAFPEDDANAGPGMPEWKPRSLRVTLRRLWTISLRCRRADPRCVR